LQDQLAKGQTQRAQTHIHRPGEMNKFGDHRQKKKKEKKKTVGSQMLLI
jgi:hypothetical protein